VNKTAFYLKSESVLSKIWNGLLFF